MAMSEPEVEWIGTSCGKHGSYTFYKGFKLTVNEETRRYLLGEFYFVRNSKDRPICIAEFQLVWHDANTGNQLASARLYFQPETIPGGRQNSHGKDELLYTDEKVVIKCRDMINLECDGKDWCYGIKAISELNLQEVHSPDKNLKEDAKKYRLCKNVLKSGTQKVSAVLEGAKIIILSFPAYCRYKTLMKKLTNGLVLSRMAIIAFGGIIKDNDCTWVSFARESFHHPELDKFDLFSDNKAPVLKGRPRKRKTKAAAGKGMGRGKHRRDADVSRHNIVGQPPLSDPDSSDDNPTDASETSSLCGQELPCPPKLVSAVKEENASSAEMVPGVIRAVKQSTHAEVRPTIIPPVPKLVKIEPKESDVMTDDQLRRPVVEVECLLQSSPVSIRRIENTVVSNISTPSAHPSVISSSFRSDETRFNTHYRSITVHPQKMSSLSREARSHELLPRQDQTRTVSVVTSVTSDSANHILASQSHPTRVSCALTATTLVSHARTSTAGGNIQARTSSVVCTPQDQTTRSLGTTLPGKTGTERHQECQNELKLSSKRKRGRTAGKSTKYLKSQGGEVRAKSTSALQQVDVNVSVAAVKSEPATSPVDIKIKTEGARSPELEDAAERDFMKALKSFMRKRGCPIEKIPALGFRKINLYKMFQVTNSLGGYAEVTAKRLWRRVYNEVGGVPSITSAATNSRKHYERLLLPYENFLKGLNSAEQSDAKPVKKEIKDVCTTQTDQNANVVSKKESVIVSQNRASEAGITTDDSSILPSRLHQHSKSAVAISENTVYTTSELSSSVEFVTTGNRGSPVVLFSSGVEPSSRGRVSSKDVSRSSPNMCYEARPRVITSVDRGRVKSEPRSPTPDHVRLERSSYLTEIIEDKSRMSASEKRRRQDPRTSRTDYDLKELKSSSPDFHQKHEYVTRLAGVDQANNIRARAQEDPRVASNTHAHVRAKNSTPEMSYESREPQKSKVTHDLRDGVLMMNVHSADGKTHSSHNRSPRPQDETFFSTFSVPVFQTPHFSHGVELYDLPNGGFPLRPSSRIFMPSTHPVFPGSSHPGATTLSPFRPHFIATVGPEHGAVYQLPITGFYPPELPYPLDAGVTILRS